LKFTITKLKDQFPSLRVDLLKKIVSAFKRLKTPGEPFVFLLLHDDTNKKTTDCLASYTSVVAKQNIFTNTSKSLWMNASEWAHYSDHDGQNLIHEKVSAIYWKLMLCVESVIQKQIYHNLKFKHQHVIIKKIQLSHFLGGH